MKASAHCSDCAVWRRLRNVGTGGEPGRQRRQPLRVLAALLLAWLAATALAPVHAAGSAAAPGMGTTGAPGRAATSAAADPALEAQVLRIAEELRCLVCQNETIAGSQSALALDLRAQIREQLGAGRNEAQIRDYMVARYGDFVLYRPPWRASTVALWVGPFALLLLALAVLRSVLRARPASRNAPDGTPAPMRRPHLDAVAADSTAQADAAVQRGLALLQGTNQPPAPAVGDAPAVHPAARGVPQ